MVKALIRILLLLAFACLAFLAIMPFIAEMRLDAAEKLAGKYLWKDAEIGFSAAIRTDPTDSRYPAGLGEFFFMQSGYKDDPVPLLEKAKGFYDHAATLNPRRAEYLVKLGQIQLSLFMESPDKREHIDKAFGDFRKAIENDPNGFNTAYAVGYSGLAVWKDLDENERTVVVDRLKYSLKQKPWYSKYIYPQVLKQTGNPGLLGPVEQKIKKR